MNLQYLLYCAISFILMKKVVPACHRGPYMNICGNDESSYNSTEIEDIEVFCDCQNVTFCTVLNHSQECNPMTIHLWINNKSTFSSTLHCQTSLLDSQSVSSSVEVLNTTENEVIVEFSPGSHFGLYRIDCTTKKIMEDFNETWSSEWEILGVNPEKVFTDTETELKLELNRKRNEFINSTTLWCFIHTENNMEVLSAVSNTNQITCSEFIPVIPGMYTVSLTSGLLPHNPEDGIRVKVIAKRPKAQRASYDNNFAAIIVHFDTNIELQSKCGKAFPKTFQQYLGMGVKCYTRGNALNIILGGEFKIITNLTIIPGNKICREGSVQSGKCLSALPTNLIVSVPKVLGPGLSFCISDACAGNKTQKHMRVTMINSHHQNFALQNQKVRSYSNGKNQRKNLIMWRGMRQVQTMFSSRLVLQVNTTDIIPLVETLTEFEDVLKVNENQLGSGANVSVSVQSSPSSSSLLAEARVSFCNDCGKPFRYKWVVNGKNLSEDGRLLSLKDLRPEKYFIQCIVLGHESTEILGQGWATAEILENPDEIFITPSELATGIADDIFLRAVSLQGNSISWTCRTAEGKPCVGRNQKLSEVYNLSSPDIFLPGGTFPVGSYIWTAMSSGGTNTAKVFITPGDVRVHVSAPNFFVNPLSDIVLNGSLSRLKENCRAGWSSARRKGFTYVDLRAVKEISVGGPPNENFPLSIPSSTLQPDSLYLFKLQIFCPGSGSLKYVKLPLRTSTPPVVTPITLRPLEGSAMITKFEVTGAGAEISHHDYPIMFDWSVIDPCGDEIPLGSGLARNFSTYLPPGEVRVKVRACSGKNICSTIITPVVTVIQSDEVREENFDECLNRMQYLMSSGDVSEAFGLAVTMFKSLALTAESQIRGKIFSAVEEAVESRITYLTRKLLSDPSDVKSSLQFCERADTVAKYFRGGSAMLSRLKQFKTTLNSNSN